MITSGCIPGLHTLATRVDAELIRHDHLFRAAAVHGDASSRRDGALEPIVYIKSQLSVVASPLVHHCLARRIRIYIARSISSITMYSSAACASDMSPGPKQIAGIPAS